MFSGLLDMNNSGEKEAMELLKKTGYTVIDTSNNREYFKKDIDIIAVKDSKETAIEVKWDSKIAETNNIFVEEYHLKNSERLSGWFEFCEADFIFYGDAVNRVFYSINFKKLKDYIKENSSSLKQRRAADYGKEGEVRKYSYGWIIPITAIADFTKQIALEV